MENQCEIEHACDELERWPLFFPLEADECMCMKFALMFQLTVHNSADSVFFSFWLSCDNS